MATAQIEVAPSCVLEYLEEKTLFQNQGAQTMLLGFEETMADAMFLEPWESITLPPSDQPIWACTPIARSGYGSTLFWGAVVEEL